MDGEERLRNNLAETDKEKQELGCKVDSLASELQTLLDQIE